MQVSVEAIHRRAINPWLYVAVGFIALLFGVNTMNILFNVLTPILVSEFGWTRGDISFGLSIFTVFDGFSLLAVGFLIDRFGIRIAVPMILVFAFGIVLLSQMSGSLINLYILCVLIGAGAAASTPTIYSIVVAAWFEKNRGIALGILNVGLGLCGTLTPFFINFVLEQWGWRSVFVVTGLAAAILPFIAYGFVLKMPPDWEVERRLAVERGKLAGAPVREIAKQHQFWLLCVGVFLISAATFGMLSQVVAIATDQGVSRLTALSILSTVSTASIVSRFFVGAMLDRIFAPLLSAAIFAICAVGVFILTNTGAGTTMFLGAMLIGVGLGAEGDIIAYIVSRYVPKPSYARIVGIMMFLYAQGGAFGIFALSLSYNLTGTYTLAVNMIIAMVVVAACAMLFMGPYKFRENGSAISQ